MSHTRSQHAPKGEVIDHSFVSVPHRSPVTIYRRSSHPRSHSKHLFLDERHLRYRSRTSPGHHAACPSSRQTSCFPVDKYHRVVGLSRHSCWDRQVPHVRGASCCLGQRVRALSQIADSQDAERRRTETFDGTKGIDGMLRSGTFGLRLLLVHILGPNTAPSLLSPASSVDGSKARELAAPKPISEVLRPSVSALFSRSQPCPSS